MPRTVQVCVVSWQTIWEAVHINQDGADAVLPIHSMGEEYDDMQNQHGNG